MCARRHITHACGHTHVCMHDLNCEVACLEVELACTLNSQVQVVYVHVCKKTHDICMWTYSCMHAWFNLWGSMLGDQTSMHTLQSGLAGHVNVMCQTQTKYDQIFNLWYVTDKWQLQWRHAMYMLEHSKILLR